MTSRAEARSERRALALFAPMLLALLLALAGGCTGSGDRVAGSRSGSSAGLENLVIVTIDTLRADRVSCYRADAPVRTAAIDGVGSRGARIDRAWSPIPLTTPAHASILTGLYPPGHGVRNNARFRLPNDVETLAEILKAHGFSTGAAISSFVTSRQFGLAQGFDTYLDDLGNEPNGAPRNQRRGDETIDAALSWLTQQQGRFFLWVHLYDPHTPYRPPPEYVRQAGGDPYSGEVAFADAQLQRLLDALRARGFDRNTVTAVLADHGEGLGTHGEKEHGVLLYEEVLHVPFVIEAPGRIAPGTVVAGPASVVDLVPTVLPLLAVPPPAGLHGIDLFAPTKAVAGRTIYAETLYPFEEFGWSALYALRRQDEKLIEAPARRLYDLAADPREGTDLAAQQADRAQELATRLQQQSSELVNTTNLAAAAGLSSEGDDPETIARLESLGYVAGGGGTAGGGGAAMPSIAGRDPHLAIDDLELFDRASDALQRGELDLAARWFTKLVHNDPQNPQFLLKLAMTHEQRQQPAETDRAYRKLLDAHPTFMLGVRRYSTFLEAQGRPLDSRNLWLRLAGLLPGYVGVETRTARAEIAAGLKAEAHDRMRRYTATNPDDHEGWVQLGAALGALGRDAEAIEALQKALAIKPTASDALETIVPIYQRTGRSAEARSYIATLQRTAPGDPALKHALELLGR